MKKALIILAFGALAVACFKKESNPLFTNKS